MINNPSTDNPSTSIISINTTDTPQLHNGESEEDQAGKISVPCFIRTASSDLDLPRSHVVEGYGDRTEEEDEDEEEDEEEYRSSAAVSKAAAGSQHRHTDSVTAFSRHSDSLAVSSRPQRPVTITRIASVIFNTPTEVAS